MSMTNLHTVTVTVDEREIAPADVTFACAGDRTAACHQYPACDCESWHEDCRREHSKVAHDECWMLAWFQAGEGAVEYDGDDDPDASGWPSEARTGPVDVTYEDGYLSWRWAA